MGERTDRTRKGEFVPQGAGFREHYGPWALVTGASSGIGEAFAREIASRGVNLVLVARRRDRLVRLARELQDAHSIEAIAVEADLCERDFLAPIEAACAGKDIGLVVSNAGFGLKGLHAEQDAERLDAMLAVNARAPMQLARAFAPGLTKRGRGGLLFTGSMEGFFGFPWSAAYSATKAFVLSLGESLWVELRAQGVDVLVLAPGATDTEALPSQGFRAEDLPGLLQPEEVARLALDRIRRGPAYVSGAMNRWSTRFLRLLPRSLAVRLAGATMRKTLGRASADGGTPPKP